MLAGDGNLYQGRRISYDGALCTVRRKVDVIPGTKGEWLGVEWDDSNRGKHNGTLNNHTYFRCLSQHPTVASFVRPTRKSDPERTLLEAIKFKYVTDQSQVAVQDTVVISGKIAEEVGFDKIIKQQSTLSDLRIAILDHLLIYGLCPRGSSLEDVRQAQDALSKTCPMVVELDLSYNPIERWADVEDICAALPHLRVLKLNIRFTDLRPQEQGLERQHFRNIRELHLNECLLQPKDIITILGGRNGVAFPSLRVLWLSQNELSVFNTDLSQPILSIGSVETLMLENNEFASLDPLVNVLALFPESTHISLQSNQLSSLGTILASSGKSYPGITNLNLSSNKVTSLVFVDQLAVTFPHLSALRLSKNPVYDTALTSPNPNQTTEKSYYLTLARIPTLKSLNYVDITPRDREEGEIYYLSVAEKDIRAALTNTNTADSIVAELRSRFPRYDSLCEKHDRENLITQLTSPPSTANPSSSTTISATAQKTYAPGTLASRLVTSTFYIPDKHSTSTPSSFTRTLPNTIPTSSIFALVSREMHLPALSFKLVYESDELDPVHNDSSTRSQMYSNTRSSADRWDEWGDWDADALVERNVNREGNEDEDRWTDDGVLIRAGRRWKRREVDVLFGMKAWGDWLETGTTLCKVRVEPFVRQKWQ